MSYHTGFYFQTTGQETTAVFQFVENKDYLNCELIEYTGERETTKPEAEARLAEITPAVIADFNARYPGRYITDVVIDQ